MLAKDFASGGTIGAPPTSPARGNSSSLSKNWKNETDEKVNKLIEELTLLNNKSELSLVTIAKKQDKQDDVVIYVLFIVAITVATMLLTALGIVIDYLSDDTSTINLNIENSGLNSKLIQ